MHSELEPPAGGGRTRTATRTLLVPPPVLATDGAGVAARDMPGAAACKAGGAAHLLSWPRFQRPQPSSGCCAECRAFPQPKVILKPLHLLSDACSL